MKGVVTTKPSRHLSLMEFVPGPGFWTDSGLIAEEKGIKAPEAGFAIGVIGNKALQCFPGDGVNGRLFWEAGFRAFSNRRSSIFKVIFAISDLIAQTVVFRGYFENEKSRLWPTDHTD